MLFRTIFIIGVATLLQWLSAPHVRMTFLLYYPALTLCCVYGYGLPALVVSALLARYLFMVPAHSWILTWPDGVILLTGYLLSGILIWWSTGRMRQALLEAEHQRQRMYSIFRRAPAAITITHGRLQKYEFVNEAYEKLIGRSKEQLLGKPVREVFGEVFSRLRNGRESVFETGERFIGREQSVTFDFNGDGQDQERFLDLVYEPVIDSVGRMEGVLSFAFDVTDQVISRRQTEALTQSLRESESQLRRLADAIPQIVYTSDATGRPHTFNHQWFEYTGLDPHALGPEDWTQSVHPADLSGVMESWLKAQSLKTTWSAEYRLRDRDGKFRWHLGRSVPVLNAQGDVVQWFGTATEIEDQKRAQEVLSFLDQVSIRLASSLDFQTTINTVAGFAITSLADWCSIQVIDEHGMPQTLAVAHKDPLRLQWAERYRALYPTDMSPGSSVPRILRTGVAELYADITDALLEQSISDPGQLRDLRALGMKSIMLIPLVSKGKPFGILSLISSESGRRYGERDLAMANELARRASLAMENARLYSELKEKGDSLTEAVRTRDEFLSIASHELKTPLTSMKLHTQLVRRHIETKGEAFAFAPEKMRKLVDQTDRGVQRLSRLVDDMLDISRIATGRLTLQKVRFDLSILVREVVERLGPLVAQAGCQIQFRTTPELIGDWDRLRIEQVISNLLMNASKYGAGQPIDIDVGQIEGFAFVRVRDHGRGIAPQDQERIFLRFERAISANEVSGLGLGLYIVRQILQAHGGAIRVESALGEGSTFVASLPIDAR